MFLARRHYGYQSLTMCVVLNQTHKFVGQGNDRMEVLFYREVEFVSVLEIDRYVKM